MDLGLRDATIVVTGGGAGIGEGITRACMAEGARVIILSRASEDVQRFMNEMNGSQPGCEWIETELGDLDRCRQATEIISSRYKRLDGLVNNAGANDGIGLESGSPERFMESIRHNLLHYYTLAHDLLPLLKASRGSIVNISSKVALTGQGGTSAYAAAKGAQLALTREWAAELLPFGVRVNAIVPAEVLTPLYRRWLDTFAEPDAALRHSTERIPLGKRMTTIEEIGAAAAFLLSPTQSSHTTGQHLFVDGGYTHLDRALT